MPSAAAVALTAAPTRGRGIAAAEAGEDVRSEQAPTTAGITAVESTLATQLIYEASTLGGIQLDYCNIPLKL